MKRLIGMLMFLGGLPTVGVAADAAPTIQDAVHGILTGTVVPVLIALIGALVSLALMKLTKRLNVKLAAETEDWISAQAERATQYVAERAAARVKAKIPIPGHEKLAFAVSYLADKTRLTPEQARPYIEAALARIAGQGATGDAVYVPAKSVSAVYGIEPVVGATAELATK